MKKRILFIFLLTLVCLLGIKVNASNEVNYTADLSNGLPSDWSLYEKSDVNYTAITKSNDGFSVNHSNTGNAQPLYYGSLINFGEEVSHLSDFTLTLEIRFTSYMDVQRWFGVMYHTQIDENNRLSGYMMNYRVIGKSAQSTVSSSSTFQDSLVVDPTGVAMSDKAFHTVKITCSGSNVTHYIDNKEIVSYDYLNYSSSLAEVQSEGGFALIVNKSCVEVKSLNITGTKVKPQAKLNTNITDLFDTEEYLIGDVGVITRVEGLEHLELIKNTYTEPHTAILSVNKDMFVLDKEGNSIELDLNTVYTEYLPYTMPAVSINDMEVAESFVSYYNTDFKYLDIFVCSNDPLVLGYLRKNITNIRGILDYSGKDVSDLAELVHTANINGANTIILSYEKTSYEDIRYIQSRFKTVWVEFDEYSELDVVNSVAWGAYGVVCPSFEEVYNALYEFEEGVNFNRMSYNVAHRGLCISSYENSLEGFIEAYESGATHLEIDVHLSKDKEIVVMHDETINRTTNGTGSVSNMTVSQLEQYQIIKNKNGSVLGDGVKIPLLREIFEEFKDKDIIFVVEIKTGDLGFADVFRALLEEYDIMDQTVVITFNTNQLVMMKDVIPEIPTANLNTINSAGFASGIASLNNMHAGIDTNHGNTNRNFTRMAALRGYSSWYWTYEMEGNIKQAMINGVLGITNNSADSIGMYATRLTLDENRIIMSKDDFENSVEFGASLYCGEYDGVVLGNVVSIEYHDNYAYAVYCGTYTFGNTSYNIFSDKIMLIDEAKYIPLHDILEVLNKEEKDLTNEDYELLERVEEAYELLTLEEQKQIDLELVNTLLMNKDANKDNGKKGCKGAIVSSFVSVGVTCLAIVYLKRKKED